MSLFRVGLYLEQEKCVTRVGSTMYATLSDSNYLDARSVSANDPSFLGYCKISKL